MLSYSSLKFFFEDINDLPYAVLKGEALSIQAYKKIGQRMSADIDILTDRNHISIFEKNLGQNGLHSTLRSRTDKIMMLSSSHQVSSWVKKTSSWSNMTIDLNFDILWGEYTGKHIEISSFLSDTIDMDIYGVKVKTLPPLKAIIQLILHHYKDMNSIFLLATRKSIKYDMFKDVFYLLKNNLNAISLDKFYNMSEKYDIIPYVYYILYHTGLLFEDNILKEYISAFKTSEGENLINCYGLNDSERREWKCDFKTRLETDSLYAIIKDNLTDKDKEKIALNKRVFLGE
jgi:hypothetical protein